MPQQFVTQDLSRNPLDYYLDNLADNTRFYREREAQNHRAARILEMQVASGDMPAVGNVTVNERGYQFDSERGRQAYLDAMKGGYEDLSMEQSFEQKLDRGNMSELQGALGQTVDAQRQRLLNDPEYQAQVKYQQGMMNTATEQWAKRGAGTPNASTTSEATPSSEPAPPANRIADIAKSAWNALHGNNVSAPPSDPISAVATPGSAAAVVPDGAVGNASAKNGSSTGSSEKDTFDISREVVMPGGEAEGAPTVASTMARGGFTDTIRENLRSLATKAALMDTFNSISVAGTNRSVKDLDNMYGNLYDARLKQLDDLAATQRDIKLDTRMENAKLKVDDAKSKFDTRVEWSQSRRSSVSASARGGAGGGNQAQNLRLMKANRGDLEKFQFPVNEKGELLEAITNASPLSEYNVQRYDLFRSNPGHTDLAAWKQELTSRLPGATAHYKKDPNTKRETIEIVRNGRKLAEAEYGSTVNKISRTGKILGQGNWRWSFELLTPRVLAELVLGDNFSTVTQ